MFSLFAHESLAYSEFLSFGGSLTPDRLLSSVFLLCHRVKVDLQFFNSCAYAQSDQWQETLDYKHCDAYLNNSSFPKEFLAMAT